jgi:hypothetical protein
MDKLFIRLLQADTYNTQTAPENYTDFDVFCKYDVEYIIGDLIWHTDFGTKEINGITMSGQTDMPVPPDGTGRSDVPRKKVTLT